MRRCRCDPGSQSFMVQCYVFEIVEKFECPLLYLFQWKKISNKILVLNTSYHILIPWIFFFFLLSSVRFLELFRHFSDKLLLSLSTTIWARSSKLYITSLKKAFSIINSKKNTKNKGNMKKILKMENYFNCGLLKFQNFFYLVTGRWTDLKLTVCSECKYV